MNCVTFSCQLPRQRRCSNALERVRDEECDCEKEHCHGLMDRGQRYGYHQEERCDTEGHLQAAGVEQGIDAFPEALHQALDNIVGNACKYSDKGQPVSVRVSSDTNNVVIVVEDNGVGVDNNEIKKIISLLGTKCRQTIESNPYCLLAFGNRLVKKAWILAESLKEKLKISDDDPRRLLGSVDKMVYDALSEGHTAILIEKAKESLSNLLKSSQVASDAIELALKKRTACVVGDFIQGVGPAELEIYIEQSFSKLLNLNSSGQGQLFDALEMEDVSQATDNYAAKFKQANGFALVAKQIDAIKIAFTKGLVVLQGEGGTGKTTALAGIKAVGIEIDRPVYFVALAGVAQRKIYRDLHKQGLINNISIKESALEIEEPTCFTIHAFINAIYRTKKAKEDSPFNLKLTQKPIIVMDESSMPDLGLFNQLLAALENTEYHLFMAGDIGQLAPVGFGVVWHKLHESKIVPYIELNQVHRQGKENPIKLAAQTIRKGELPILPAFEKGIDTCGVFISECVNPELIEESFDCAVKLGINESQIIAPTKQLVDKINKFVQGRMLTQEVMADDSACFLNRFYRGDRVICTENNYDMGLLLMSTHMDPFDVHHNGSTQCAA